MKFNLQRFILLGAVGLFSLQSGLRANPAVWDVDYNKSNIKFTVDSFFGDVDGYFQKWNWSGNIDSNFLSKGKLTINASSIDTKNQKRDDHLRDPDFFEVSKYPSITFVVKKSTPLADEVELEGDLTILKTTKAMKIVFRKNLADPNVPSFKATFPINKNEFGLTYNSSFNPMEEEVVVRINLVLKKK